MTVKEYLNQVRYLDKEIDAKIDHLESIESKVNRVTMVMSDMPRSPLPDNTKRENLLVKMIDLKWEINNDIDRLVDAKREINEFLGTLGRGRHRLLLELRYINYCTWERIAEIMDVSLSTVYRIHGSALVEAETFYKKFKDDIV